MKTFGAAIIALSLLACRPDDQKTESIDPRAARDARAAMPPRVALHLDSGNIAFRRKDYPTARRHYDAAIRADEKQPAGWFGIYMVELAEGNAPQAQAALKKAQKLVPGATLLHPKQQ